MSLARGKAKRGEVIVMYSCLVWAEFWLVQIVFLGFLNGHDEGFAAINTADFYWSARSCGSSTGALLSPVSMYKKDSLYLTISQDARGPWCVGLLMSARNSSSIHVERPERISEPEVQCQRRGLHDGDLPSLPTLTRCVAAILQNCDPFSWRCGNAMDPGFTGAHYSGCLFFTGRCFIFRCFDRKNRPGPANA